LPGGIVVDARQARIPGKALGVTTVKTVEHRTVHLTLTEAPTDGAIVIISKLSALRPEKPKPEKVLSGPDERPVISTVENSKPVPQ
jgi:hypothetical protein